MEQRPESPKLSWQDITIETVHELVAENQLEQARLAAKLRIEVLEQLCEDTEDAIANRCRRNISYSVARTKDSDRKRDSRIPEDNSDYRH